MGPFCTRRCMGLWLGPRVGFGVHRKGWGSGGVKPQYDYEVVWQAHLDTGEGYRRLSRRLKIPESTMNFILRKMRPAEKDPRASR